MVKEGNTWKMGVESQRGRGRVGFLKSLPSSMPTTRAEAPNASVGVKSWCFTDFIGAALAPWLAVLLKRTSR